MARVPKTPRETAVGKSPPPSADRPAPLPAGRRSEERTVLFDARGKRRDDATRILSTADVGAEAARFKLVAVRGPRQGKQFPLRGTELNLGRDEKNDVVIPDISVARRHARLRRHADGWTIASLSPDAAIRVNGLRVEDHRLVSGDLVEFGKAELQFVEATPEAVRAVQSRPPLGEFEREITKPRARVPGSPKSRPGVEPATTRRGGGAVRKAAIACLSVVVIALAAKALWRRPSAGGQVGGARAPGPAAETVDPLEDASPEQLFALARKAMIAGKWTDAQGLMARALQLDPQNAQYKRYLDASVAEQVNQKHLDAAAVGLEQSDLKTAYAEVALVAADSLLSDQAAQLRSKIDAALAKAIAEGQAALAAGDLEGTGTNLEIAQGGDPKNPEVIALKLQLDARKSLRQQQLYEQSHQAAARVAATRHANGPLGMAETLFRNGDIKGALTALGNAGAADATAAASMQEAIGQAGGALKEGKTAAASGDSAKAAELLTRARRLADKIVPGSAIAAEAGRTLSGAEDTLGLNARAKGALDQAYRHFAAALAANPEDLQAKSELKRLEADAHELFVAAYSQRETDPEAAERKFRQVLELTSPAAPDHKSAEQRLGQMRGQERQ